MVRRTQNLAEPSPSKQATTFRGSATSPRPATSVSAPRTPAPAGATATAARTAAAVTSPAAAVGERPVVSATAAPRAAGPAKPVVTRRGSPALRSAPKSGARGAALSALTSSASTDEGTILYQSYFKSVGPRTYAVQVKEASNGNHAVVLIEGKRDPKTNELRKHRLYVWSEDFPAFFSMLNETVKFIRANPVSEEVKRKRQKYWAKKSQETDDDLSDPVPAHPTAKRRSR